MRCLLPFIAVLAVASAAAGAEAPEQPDPYLMEKLRPLVEAFGGVVGLYVRQLETGKAAAFRADELFPTASLVKVPLLVALFDRVDRGLLDYHRVLTYRVAERSPTAGMLNAFKDGETVDVALLATLMMEFSDNDASLWCQELAGGGEGVNHWLDTHGFRQTRVNSRTAGREADWQSYGWGQSTPRELAELMVRIHERRAVSPAADEEMIRVLSRNYWDGNALIQIPPTVHVMSKGGSIGSARSETIVVDAPSGAYVMCVMTRDQKDQDWGRDNAGQQLRREISRVLWHHFEPASDWHPPGTERFR
jgi:beta-lactamase class A